MVGEIRRHTMQTSHQVTTADNNAAPNFYEDRRKTIKGAEEANLLGYLFQCIIFNKYRCHRCDGY